MGEVRESSDGSLCTTVQPQVHLVVFSEPDRVGIVGCQRVQAGSMATGTALRGSSPCPVARRDCTFEREGGNLILVAQDERSLHLVPTDVPPVPGSPHGPTHVGGCADPGRRTAQITTQVGGAQPGSLEAVRARYLALGAVARVVIVSLANRRHTLTRDTKVSEIRLLVLAPTRAWSPGRRA